MTTIKKLSVFSTALLMTAVMGSAYAEEADMAQIRTQDRVRTETNLQTPATDSSQSRFQKKNQVRHEYKYRNKFQTQEGGVGASSMNRQSMPRSSNGGGRR